MKRSRINPISQKRRARSGIAGKLGIVRLYGKDMEELRRQRYAMDGGRCQFIKEDGAKCNKFLPWDGDLFKRAHLMHIVSRGRGGSDVITNVLLGCYYHHIVVEHGGGKVVPAK